MNNLLPSEIVPFWLNLERFGTALALKQRALSLTYAELAERVARKCEQLKAVVSSPKPLIFIKMSQSIESVINYLACLQSESAALLLPFNLNAPALNDYKTRFRPNIFLVEEHIEVLHDEEVLFSKDLAILMTTSGSTGAGKCVALSHQNLCANTQAICEYLPISAQDITLATLPLSYSYGLSVLNSHLAVGAKVVFTSDTVFDKRFWNTVRNEPITSLAGVPTWYQMLLRLRFTEMILPKLRYFTQAGGRLAPEYVVKLSEYADRNDKEFYVMYGQTEATARMAYLPPAQVLQKPDAIGQAIPGGSMRINDSGELEYAGPNVMLGYVNDQGDLSEFKKIKWLATGDLVERDASGDYRIIGRKKRMIKVAGERVNLDALEQRLSLPQYQVLCVGQDEKLIVCCLESDYPMIQEHVGSRLEIPYRNYDVVPVKGWPLLPSGKYDYGKLLSLSLSEPESESDRRTS